MTFARFRISTHAGLQPWGFAADGEVEDYALLIDPISPSSTLTTSYEYAPRTSSQQTGRNESIQNREKVRLSRRRREETRSDGTTSATPLLNLRDTGRANSNHFDFELEEQENAHSIDLSLHDAALKELLEESDNWMNALS